MEAALPFAHFLMALRSFSGSMMMGGLEGGLDSGSELVLGGWRARSFSLRAGVSGQRPSRMRIWVAFLEWP